MAKLERLPDAGTIVSCRGLVDFYLWKGVPCARRWPKKSTQPRTAGEIASSELFTAAAVMTGAIAPVVMELYRSQMAGKGVTWVDWFRATARGKPWVHFGN